MRASDSLSKGEERGTECPDTLLVENLCCLNAGTSGGYFNAVSITNGKSVLSQNCSGLGFPNLPRDALSLESLVVSTGVGNDSVLVESLSGGSLGKDTALDVRDDPLGESCGLYLQLALDP